MDLENQASSFRKSAITVANKIVFCAPDAKIVEGENFVK